MASKTKGGHDTDFLMRIVHSLGHESLLDMVLASEGTLRYDDLEALRGARAESAPVDQSETWQKILAYTNKRIGLLLSVREEIVRKVNNDRRARDKRRKDIECR